MQENLKILGKNQEFLARVWYLSHDQLPSLLLSFILWNSVLGKWPRQWGLPLPQLWFHPRRSRQLVFFILPRPFCRSSVLEGMTKRTRASLPHLAPTHRAEALPQAQQAKNTGSSIVPSQLTHRAEVSWEGQVRYQLSPHYALIEQEFHSRRNRLPSPSLGLVQ